MHGIIHEAFSDVLLCDARLCLNLIKVNNKLVGNSPILTSILYTVVVFELFSHVVGVQNCLLRALEQSIGSTKLNVGIRDWQNTSIAVGSSVYCSSLATCDWHNTMTWQEGL